MLSVQFIYFGIIILNTIHVWAVNMDDLKQQYAAMIMECATDFSITSADIEKLKNNQIPDNEASKCLFACAYKKSGMMDDQGNLSVEGVNKIAQMYFANDPARLEQAKQFTEACKSVNDEPVSDGKKGCDRAALLFKCSVEKASQFDFGL